MMISKQIKRSCQFCCKYTSPQKRHTTWALNICFCLGSAFAKVLYNFSVEITAMMFIFQLSSFCNNKKNFFLFFFIFLTSFWGLNISQSYMLLTMYTQLFIEDYDDDQRMMMMVVICSLSFSALPPTAWGNSTFKPKKLTYI